MAFPASLSSVSGMRKRLTTSAMTVALLGPLTLSGCSPASQDNEAVTGVSSQSSAYAALGALAAIERLEQLRVAQRPQGLVASVRADELVLTENGASTSMPLPAEKFYLSVAPFKTYSHECFFHSLTTCEGELSPVPVSVKVSDDSGNLVLEKTTVTADNGFVGLWLPRNIKGTLSITSQDASGEVPISTGNDAPTY